MLSLLQEGCGKMSHRDESGFTMLEILVSIAILSIAVLPLLGLLTSAPLLHAQREQQTRAAFLAQRKVEEVRNRIIGDNDFDFTTEYDEPATGFPAPDPTFKYTITVTDPAPDPGDLKDITVQVWYDENGVVDTPEVGEQAVRLETKVAKRREIP